MVRPWTTAAIVFACSVAACAQDADPLTERPPVTATDPPPSEPVIPPDPTAAAADARQALLVRGIFDPTGAEMVRLDPAAVVPGPAREPVSGTRGLFVLEVTFADGSVTRVPFDALIADDSGSGTTEHGFFEVSAPVDGEIVDARVLRADGSVVAEVPLEQGE